MIMHSQLIQIAQLINVFIIFRVVLPSFENDVSTTASERDRNIAFVYPLDGGVNSIQVRKWDVDNQENSFDKYLTDTAIDFMTKHIVDTVYPRSPTFKPFNVLFSFTT